MTTPTNFAEARATIATALSSVSANVYAFPAEAIFPPAVVIVIDEPMAEIKTIGSRTRLMAKYRLQLVAPILDNLATLEKLEALVLEVLPLLPVGGQVGAIGGINVQQVGTAEYAVIELPYALGIETT